MAGNSSPDPQPYRMTGNDVQGLLLLVVSAILLLALLDIASGRLTAPPAEALRWLFGIGAIPIVLLAGAIGALMVLRVEPRSPLTWGRLFSLELLALCLLAITTLVRNPSLSWTWATEGVGGGTVGWLLAQPATALTRWGWLALLCLIALALLPTVLGIDLDSVERWFNDAEAKLNGFRQRLMPTPDDASTAAPPAAADQGMDAASLAEIVGEAPEVDAGQATGVKASTKAEKAPKSTAKVTSNATTRTARKKGGYALPGLDLLNSSSGDELDPNIAREKAHIIEKTLKQFGVEATVVQVNQGPAVTQFGVQPGFSERTLRDGTVRRRKVKVNAITSLADDLALALAAKSIRVEAPVPGRPYVGIEVPNSDTEMVTLHSVLVSKAFKSLDSQLAFALGRDVSGQPVAADLGRMPHLLIAGATGAGKSVCINTIIASFLFRNNPDQLKFLMIDPKMVELIPYNGIPHLIAPVVTDMERAVGALTWAMREMDRRYKLFSAAAKRNLDSYNAMLVQQGDEPLPYIVIVIDELADLMMVAADQVERLISRIAQMARATGIHLLLATQRPSVDVVTGLIKANVPARIAFAVASQIDSRVILDTGGAEALLGRGDMLFQAPDSSKLHRLQGCFVSDHELSELVGHWLRQSKPHPTASVEANADEAPWEEILEELQQGDEPSDELLPEAIRLVREHQWASTSFLQRKLRIGYNRAARLIDMLEAQGVIGPSEEGSNSSREVLMQAQGGGIPEEAV
ncbi:MAG: DNA translocase FtsK [Anaerolineales bacterium]|nr:DNA translocase FtsK [Anaerolineales bacterium]MCB9128370.1 DNA translocase FtsK [Ardenticatenales bacterium]MCB9172182.1 DNA translocase FtsK [Ardenticatenales bacterium]